MSRARSALGSAAVVLAALLAPSAQASTNGPIAGPGERQVLVVGNNWEGTADVVDSDTFERLERLNIVPDLPERMGAIATDPQALGYFLAVRTLIGENNDQFVDDAFTSDDGRFLYVSRPSLRDVVAFDLATDKIVWRVQIEGYRSDHMAISPDSKRLLVSDSTARKVHVIDTAKGEIVDSFPSGDSPHENNFSADGKRIYHASIGMVYTPADEPVLDSTKGDRWFQIVDGETYEVKKRVDIGKQLAEQGKPGYSSAVRPIAITPDERFAYMQLSFLHGFVEYDLKTMKPTRIANLPVSEEAKKIPKEDYLLDSAHHGIAISGDKLCVAGTMSDYAAIVDRKDFSYEIASKGSRPYWSTNSVDGKYCFISYSGDDAVSVVSYRTGKEVARFPVGNHPQRMRNGVVRQEFLPPSTDATRPSVTRVRMAGRGTKRSVRVQVSERAVARVVLQRGFGKLGKRRWRDVRTLEQPVAPGVVSIGLGKLRRGAIYRVKVTATDASGNRSSTALKRFRAGPRRR